MPPARRLPQGGWETLRVGGKVFGGLCVLMLVPNGPNHLGSSVGSLLKPDEFSEASTTQVGGFEDLAVVTLRLRWLEATTGDLGG